MKDNNKIIQAIEHLRRAVQMFAANVTEEQALEIPSIYPKYKVGKEYKTGDIFAEGVNGVGDAQLYKVVQDHTSMEGWHPSSTPSLYVAIGLNKEGYPVWSKPSGAHDAYNMGDIVDYNGKLYKSLIDGNVYSPDEYPAGWELYEEQIDE